MTSTRFMKSKSQYVYYLYLYFALKYKTTILEASYVSFKKLSFNNCIYQWNEGRQQKHI